MSKEIQAKVLCALLSDRYLLSRVMSDGFTADVFSDPNLRIIFKAAWEMSHIAGQVIDWITIEDTLKKREWYNPEVGQALETVKSEEPPIVVFHIELTDFS
jgi:replicative DNA helicase